MLLIPLALSLSLISGVAPASSLEGVGVLDPSLSYGFVISPFDASQTEHIKQAVAGVTDINILVDLALANELFLESLTLFDTEYDESIVLYAAEQGHPRTNDALCGDRPNTDIGVRSGSDHDYYNWFVKWTSYMWEVRYFPAAPLYPYSRFAVGSAKWTRLNHIAVEVSTDFYWRSGHNGPLHYWTTQEAWGWKQWLVGLYAGDSSINFVQRSCTWFNQEQWLEWF